MKMELRIEGRLVVIEACGGFSVKVLDGEETAGPAAEAEEAKDAPPEEASCTAPAAMKEGPGWEAKAAPAPAAEGAPAANGLFARLADLRRELAVAQGVPTYVVFQDKALLEMAEKRPQTLDAFSRITGVGKAKLEKYGDIFLSAIREGEAA